MSVWNPLQVGHAAQGDSLCLADCLRSNEADAGGTLKKWKLIRGGCESVT